MGPEPRLALVALCLAANVGCFDLESTVVLQPSGKGTLALHVGLYPPFASGANLRPPLDRDAIKKLKKQGIKKYEYTPFSDTERGEGFDVSLKFKRLASLDALGSDSLQPDYRLDDLGGGHYRLSTHTSADLGGATRPPKPPPDPSQAMPDLDTMLRGLGGLGSLEKMKMVVTFEVPGAIEHIEPSWGTIAGHTVTWTVDSTRLLSGGIAGASSKSEFAVDFAPKRAFPANALDGQAKGVAPL
jgi:hypothetical protein